MNVTDEIIRQKITAAMDEPSVPAEVVERAVDRINAVTAGREAEKQLSSLDAGASASLKTELAAKAVTGRLLSNRRPPKNITSGLMTRQLVENGNFRKLTSGDPVRLEHDIRSGELFKKLAYVETQKEAGTLAQQNEIIKEAPAADDFSL